MPFVAVDSDRIRMRNFLKYFYVFQPKSDIVMFLDCKDAEKYIEEKNVDILFTAEGDEYTELVKKMHSRQPLAFSTILTNDIIPGNKKLIAQNLAVVSRENFTEVADWVISQSDELLFSE